MLGPFCLPANTYFVCQTGPSAASCLLLADEYPQGGGGLFSREPRVGLVILWGGRNHNLVGRRRGLGKGGGWWECGGLSWSGGQDLMTPFPALPTLGNWDKKPGL